MEIEDGANIKSSVIDEENYKYGDEVYMRFEEKYIVALRKQEWKRRGLYLKLYLLYLYQYILLY